MAKMKAQTKKEKQGIKFHLEGLADAAHAIVRNCYPLQNDGRTPKGLQNVQYVRLNEGGCVRLFFCYAHKGSNYEVTITEK